MKITNDIKNDLVAAIKDGTPIIDLKSLVIAVPREYDGWADFLADTAFDKNSDSGFSAHSFNINEYMREWAFPWQLEIDIEGKSLPYEAKLKDVKNASIKRAKKEDEFEKKINHINSIIDSFPVDDKMKEEVATYIYRYLNERMSALK